MKIKWKISIAGTVHNRDGGVKPGDVMEVDDESGTNYIAFGYAEAVKPGGKLSEEHAIQNFSDEERAVLNKEVVGASLKPIPQAKPPKPAVVEPEPEVEVKPKPVYGKTYPPDVKRSSGRPRKA